jgi:ABC-type molybdate transport system substrate-binding protein
VIRDTRYRAAAVRFVQTVLSSEGQKILAKYGFLAGR